MAPLVVDCQVALLATSGRTLVGVMTKDGSVTVLCALRRPKLTLRRDYLAMRSYFSGPFPVGVLPGQHRIGSLMADCDLTLKFSSR